MRQAVTQAKKARRHCSPPYWDFMHNAPVWARRQHGMYGYDHLLYDQVHGLMGGSAAAVMPDFAGFRSYMLDGRRKSPLGYPYSGL